MKAQRPPPAPRSRWSARVEALGAAGPPGQDPSEARMEEKGRSERSRNEHQSLHHTRSALVRTERPFSAQTAVFHC